MPWTLLGILLAVCAVMCAVGFYKFVYFLSIGYGFAIAGGGIAIFVMYLMNPTATPIWLVLVQMVLFIAYGARLSGFLLVREFKTFLSRKQMLQRILWQRITKRRCQSLYLQRFGFVDQFYMWHR